MTAPENALTFYHSISVSKVVTVVQTRGEFFFLFFLSTHYVIVSRSQTRDACNRWYGYRLSAISPYMPRSENVITCAHNCHEPNDIHQATVVNIGMQNILIFPS
jgi:hypothetical protein